MWQERGFVQDNTDVNEAVKRLETHIDFFPGQFGKISGEEITIKPASGKWSKKEILGHLIDSAVNNLKRFTEIQFLPSPYTVISYRQEELVSVNKYQQLPTDHLLLLWQTLNRQVLFVIKNIPPEKLEYPVDPQYDNREMKTLGWIICDYVAHMEHHFRQIFPGADY